MSGVQPGHRYATAIPALIQPAAGLSTLDLLGRKNSIVDVLSPFPEDGAVDDLDIVDSFSVPRGRAPEDESGRTSTRTWMSQVVRTKWNRFASSCAC